MDKPEYLPRFDFKKGPHTYSFHYDDTCELINHIVDLAESCRFNLDLIDMFAIVKALAKYEKESKVN